MRVLVLQQPSSVAPFESWLREASGGVEVRIVTGKGTARADDSVAPGVVREVLGDYRADTTTRRIFEICAEWRPDVVFSNAEADVLRAAEARTLFGIPGMKSSSAVLFRDKVLMKRLFAGLSVEPVAYRVPTSAVDVLSACAELGPVVLKPRDGAGAVGVEVFRSPDEAGRRLAAKPELLDLLHRSRLILEVFTEGDVYHVDILVRDGKPILVSPSRYLIQPHRYAERNLASAMTDENAEDHKILTAYAEELTAAIAPEHQPHIMHLEVYRTPDGTFRAGEIACRGGGALIKESMLHTYGVDQARASCLLHAGLLPDATYRRRVGPQSGWALETGIPFRFDPSTVPGWIPVWRGAPRTKPPTESVDAGWQVVVEGTDQSDIAARIDSLDRGPR
jgi:biotin carboxylase